ncbi:MAG: hypothetical protein J5502_02615 [Prevotella sp.]|nr:hypothetical protein [Prevotella sp.]
MKTIEQKRKYEKPAMRVFKLKQQPQLLTGSIQGQAGVQDYTITKDGDNDWEW